MSVINLLPLSSRFTLRHIPWEDRWNSITLCSYIMSMMLSFLSRGHWSVQGGTRRYKEVGESQQCGCEDSRWSSAPATHPEHKISVTLQLWPNSHLSLGPFNHGIQSPASFQPHQGKPQLENGVQMCVLLLVFLPNLDLRPKIRTHKVFGNIHCFESLLTKMTNGNENFVCSYLNRLQLW